MISSVARGRVFFNVGFRSIGSKRRFQCVFNEVLKGVELLITSRVGLVMVKMCFSWVGGYFLAGRKNCTRATYHGLSCGFRCAPTRKKYMFVCQILSFRKIMVLIIFFTRGTDPVFIEQTSRQYHCNIH